MECTVFVYIKTLFSTMMARFLSDQAALINLINIMNIFCII